MKKLTNYCAREKVLRKKQKIKSNSNAKFKITIVFLLEKQQK